MTGAQGSVFTSSNERSASPVHSDIGVIALVLERWGPHWTSRHQILMRLAQYFHVLWLNPALEWRESIRRFPRLSPPQPADLPRLPPAFTIHDSASWLPVVYRPAWLGDRLARARLRRARAVLEQRGCTRVVLYLWHPSLAPALDQVSHDLSCYHIYDEYSHAEVEQPLDPAEVRLIQSVDQVFIASPLVFERKGVFNPHSLWVSNGVEFAAFSTPVPEPADLAPIPRPRLGYAGFIKKQLDWQLIAMLARRRPEWSFVFVGARRQQPELPALLEEVSALPNVHFLGEKTAIELAHYPQHFDVCIMPYCVDGYTKYIYPLKLHEYLASGRPAVGTRLPVLEAVGDVVGLASGPEEWERAIEQALRPEAGSVERRAARQQRAMQHDWSRITARIAEAISTRLADLRSGREIARAGV
jgi:glycosyltransferase involved in cell wall biosynthesis